MTREGAEKYAENMTYREAICNLKQAKSVPYRKATFIKVDELLDKLEQEPRWIPVTERLPEEIFGCLVTVWDANPKTGEEFENILPEFAGYDGETWNGADGKPIAFEVAAWMPLPQPYKAESEG